MKEIKCGVQTITWGSSQVDFLDRVFEEAASCGYSGVEVGIRRLEKVTAKEVKQMLKNNGLAFVASHIGGNLEDLSQAEKEREDLEKQLEYLSEAGTTLLNYSGLKFTNEEQLLRDVESLNAVAETCMKHGIQLLYHNHDYEFLHDQKVYRALIEQGSSQLGFCPDVGWVHKAGVEVLPLLEEISDRIQLIHFKEFRSLDKVVDTVPLGEGIVPLQEIAEWLRSQEKELWVISEQDNIQEGETPYEIAKQNADFLKTIFTEKAKGMSV